MDKERVIIEYMEGEKVAVYSFYNNVISAPLEVCHKETAREQYNVVGELTEEGIELYDREEDDEEEDDYSEFSNIDEDDN